MEFKRTCLVCRNSESRGELLRFVRALDGEICFDEKAVAASRGAWICATKACLSKGFLKRLLFKGEKTIAVQGEVMITAIANRIKKSTLLRLGILKRIGQIECGREAVARLVTSNKADLVIFACDLASRSRRDLGNLLSDEAKQVSVIDSPFSMQDLGNYLGRGKTGVVALTKSRISKEVAVHLGMLSDIE